MAEQSIGALALKIERSVAKRSRNGMPMSWLRSHATFSDTAACLTWPFSRNGAGYGQLWQKRKLFRAHRLMCILAHGAPPTPSHHAAHSCGHGSDGCVNPHHLRWATKTENEADKRVHGTSNDGERHPMAKLTAPSVIEIRSLAGTLSHGEIADRFGVCRSAVTNIINRKNWRHV